ncbi:hypothetical protein BJX70DRAFT_364706 [Aspergillus crustosus]
MGTKVFSPRDLNFQLPWLLFACVVVLSYQPKIPTAHITPHGLVLEQRGLVFGIKNGHLGTKLIVEDDRKICHYLQISYDPNMRQHEHINVSNSNKCFTTCDALAQYGTTRIALIFLGTEELYTVLDRRRGILAAILHEDKECFYGRELATALVRKAQASFTPLSSSALSQLHPESEIIEGLEESPAIDEDHSITVSVTGTRMQVSQVWCIE